MKFWKHSLISAFTFLGIATTVLYTACQDDSCTRLTCRNGGSCSEGFCRCPTGYEGSECQDRISARFVGFYYGTTNCDTDPAPVLDSAAIFVVKQPNIIGITRYSALADTFTGTISAGTNSMIVNQNGALVTVSVENGKANFYVERTVDGKPVTCRFIGNTKK